MNKIFLVGVIAVLIVLGVSALGAAAQEQPESPAATATPIINPDNPPAMPEVPAELPDTAVEATDIVVGMLAALFAAFAGMVGFGLTDVLKEYVPWLDKKHRERLGQGVTRLLIMAFNVLIGIGADFLFKAATDLDATGLWGALATVITVIGVPVFAQVWYSWNKGASVNIKNAVNPAY